MTGLAPLLQEIGQWFAVAWVLFLRVGTAMLLLPAFGEQVVPMRLRLMAGVAFTALLLPILQPQIAPLLPAAGIAPIHLLSEPAIGLLFGAGLRLMVHALQIAAVLIAQSTSLAQAFSGTGPEPLPAIGHLLTLAGLTLALIGGLPVRLVAAFLATYDILPPGQLPQGAVVMGWGVATVAESFGLGFSLAAAFVIAGLLYNVALGVINRALPQLMVVFIGAPLLTAGAILLLLQSAPLLLEVWHGALVARLTLPFGP